MTLLAVLVATCAGCTRLDRPPIILLTIDTLRADHLPVYGYERNTAPAIAALARDGVTFDRAFTTAPKTTPAIASLFTGAYPYRHGLRALGQELARENATVAEWLSDVGYDTAGFVSSTVMIDRLSGLGQGFRLWDDRMPSRETSRENYERKADATAAAVMATIARGFEPGLLFVHLIDPHGPYAPPGRFEAAFDSHDERPLDPARIPRFQRLPHAHSLSAYVAAYDGEISFADHAIASVVDRLREIGVYQNALLVLTADHGESFGEDGYYFRHGKSLHEVSTRIPLIIKPPGGRGRHAPERWSGVVSLVDLTPTILDYAGVAIPAQLDGESLRPVLEGEGPARERIVFSERALGSGAHWAAHGRHGTLLTEGCFDDGSSADSACSRGSVSARGDSGLPATSLESLATALKAHVGRARGHRLPFIVTWRYHPSDREFVRRFVRHHNARWTRYQSADASALRGLGYLE